MPIFAHWFAKSYIRVLSLLLFITLAACADHSAPTSTQEAGVAGVAVTPIKSTTGEDGSSGSFTVALTSAPTADVTINISSSDTTEGTIDPNQNTLTLTFTTSNYNEPHTVIITGVDDIMVDGNVAYTIITAAAQSADINYDGLNPDDVRMTNIDNDTAGFVVSGTSGHTSESGATATFTIALGSRPTGDVSVALNSSNEAEGSVSATPIVFSASAASPADPGYWATPQTVTVTGVDDNIADGPQTYTIQFAVSSTDPAYDQNNPPDVSVINDDNEGVPSITLSFDQSAIPETGGTATLSATADYTSTKDIVVSVGFTTGSATLGSDFTVTNNNATITIPANSTSATTTVSAVSDILYEGDETIVANIASSNNAVASGAPPASLTISDDDPQPLVSLSIDHTSIDEASGGLATLTASLADASGKPITSGVPVTVNLSYSGTATAGSDYTGAVTSITIPAGEVSSSSDSNGNAATLTAQDDNLIEGDETIIVGIDTASLVVAQPGSKPTATTTIIDNDVPVVSFDSEVQSVSEGVGTVSLKVNLDQAGVQDISLPFSVDAASTASATGGGTDYTLATSPITIPAGQTSASIDIEVVDDTLIEPDETVIIHLATPTNARLGTTITNTLTITNNDYAVSGAVSPDRFWGHATPAAATVNANSTTTVEVSANNGYAISSISGCAGTPVNYTATQTTNTLSATYTTGAITADCTVTATFADVEPPFVRIEGDNPIFVPLNATYSDPRTSLYVVDNVDGSSFVNNNVANGAITVMTDIAVNTAAEGTYTVTYTVKDTAGNTSTATRTVIVMKPFITTWKTFNPGIVTSSNTQIKIGTEPTGTYNYTVDWGDTKIDTNVTGDITHTYAVAGTYTVTIYGEFPQIYFDGSNYDNSKLLSVEQWGGIQWQSMHNAFYSCRNLVVNATDIPDLSQVTDMSGMFYDAANFNQDISGWNVSTVTDMGSMFARAIAFNQPLNKWDVSSVTNMSSMFNNADTFDQDLSTWNTSAVTNMSYMFAGANAFNRNLSAWNTSAVTDMSYMFNYADTFDQDISTWNTSAVTNMSYMFDGAIAFNHPINTQQPSALLPNGAWNVSKVKNMGYMFSGASAFDQDISAWKPSSATNMNYMFSSATAFNQPIGGWDVSNVINMSDMFSSATAFNQPIGGWNVSKVWYMRWMFYGSAFDQDIGRWNISSVIDLYGMFRNATLSTANYDALLKGWSTKPIHSGLDFDAGNSQYTSTDTAVMDARAILTNLPSDIPAGFEWVITDGGPAP